MSELSCAWGISICGAFLSPFCAPVELLSIKQKGSESWVVVECSFGEETRVSRGFITNVSMIGVDVEDLALSSKVAIVDEEALPTPLEVVAMESPETRR
jgi:hypothetical protein